MVFGWTPSAIRVVPQEAPPRGRSAQRPPERRALGAAALPRLGLRRFRLAGRAVLFPLFGRVFEQGSLKDTFCPFETWLFPPK